MKKNYVAIAKSYLETPEEDKKTKSHLRRMLEARGLDPRHEIGLVERAIIFSNQPLVNNYCTLKQQAECAGKFAKVKQARLDRYEEDLRNLEKDLKSLGLTNLTPEYLLNTLANIKTNQRKVERKKNPTFVNMARRQADQERADFEAEIAKLETEATELGLRGSAFELYVSGDGDDRDRIMERYRKAKEEGMKLGLSDEPLIHYIAGAMLSVTIAAAVG